MNELMTLEDCKTLDVEIARSEGWRTELEELMATAPEWWFGGFDREDEGTYF